MRSLIAKIQSLKQETLSEGVLRLWSVFLTARMALAVILIFIQALTFSLQEAEISTSKIWITSVILGVYLLQTIVMRALVKNQVFVQKHRLMLWLMTAGLDFVIFNWMYSFNGQSENYSFLFVFNVLMVAALGQRWMIYTVLVVIFGCVLIQSDLFSGGPFFFSRENINSLLALLITCLGFFVIAEFTYMMAVRMRKEELRATEGLSSARQQEMINHMIVAEMSVGVVVADYKAGLMLINPAAITLITGDSAFKESEKMSECLQKEPGWLQLQDVVKTLFDSDVIGNRLLVFDLLLQQSDGVQIMLQIKGRVLENIDSSLQSGQRLCVLFMTDTRDVDRRLQQEKLAAMGRMSASIAHEIRNPLATIVSANALLAEGMKDTGSKRLTEMIATNAQRLSKIIKDVLDVAHMQNSNAVDAIDLLTFLPDVIEHWVFANTYTQKIKTYWPEDIFGIFISFDEDHLRRVLENLLNNALRYATKTDGSILVTCQVYQVDEGEMVRISVLSDGKELSEHTQKQLFEPFFSTEARGTGLGLYISRSLCTRYNASLDYQRTALADNDQERSYNEFYITANRVDPLPGETRILIEQVRN